MKLARLLVGLLLFCAVLTSGLIAQTSSSATQRVTFGIIRTASVTLASAQKALVQQGEIALKPYGVGKITVGTDGSDEMSIENVEREGRVNIAMVSALAGRKGIQKSSTKQSFASPASSSHPKKDRGSFTITLTD